MVSVHCSVVCQNRNGCSGNGECVLGECQCDTGHTGTCCETSEYYIYWLLLVMKISVMILSTDTIYCAYSCVCTERFSNMRQCYGRCRMSCTKIYWDTTVPHGCPSSDVTIKKEQINVIAQYVFVVLSFIMTPNHFIGPSWLQSSHKFKLSGDSSLLSISSIR